jgi:hypothetical protein
LCIEKPREFAKRYGRTPLLTGLLQDPRSLKLVFEHPFAGPIDTPVKSLDLSLVFTKVCRSKIA